MVAALFFVPMNELPQKAHPAATAFFDALDQYNQQQEEGGVYQDNDNDSNNESDAITKVAAPPISESLRRKSQSLGWRNRNSQKKYYPVTVLQSSAVSKSKEDIDSTASTQQQNNRRLRRRNFSVHQVQRGEVEGTYGTGATIWPAAVVLIKYLERNTNYGSSRNGNDTDNSGQKIHHNVGIDNSAVTLRGRHVIDLGGGTGVTSIAAALLGATSVVCTDGEESVVRLARNNIRRASHQLSVSLCSSQSELSHQGSHTISTSTATTEMTNPSLSDVEEEKILSTMTDNDNNNDDTGITVTIDDCPIRAQRYWWGDETSRNLLSTTEDNGLVILVADCVLPKLYPIAPLVQAIDDCLRLYDDEKEKCGEQSTSPAPSSSFALLSYEHRYYPEYDPRIEFRRLASERCLDVFTVPRDEMDPVYSLEDVEIWIVRRRLL